MCQSTNIDRPNHAHYYPHTHLYSHLNQIANMTTLDDVLQTQKDLNILYAPSIPSPQVKKETVATTSSTLSVGLYNSTNSSNVTAYITGLSIDDNNALFLLQSDGATPYFPDNPSSTGTALSSNCGIALGAPNTTTSVTIPHIAGGRIWFCVNDTLTFLLNPGQTGAGLVEPSVSNTSDPNYFKSWDFCEFTYNESQLYANITYVDFVSLPIALDLTTGSGATQHVGGLPADGLTTICAGLQQQQTVDGAGWDQLIITNNGNALRALSPSNGILFNENLFSTYWNDYIDQVWAQYVSTPLVVDTQATWGTVTGHTSNDRTQLTFGDVGSFSKPSAQDIFGANSGAFAAQPTNTAELLNIGARLDAAFNRSTLMINSNQPDGEVSSTYYQNVVTNHYARIVHAANVDGRGYAFPYDDVVPNGGDDQSGFVSDGAPQNLLVTVGGGNAHARREIRQRGIVAPKRSMMKRSVRWKEPTSQSQSATLNAFSTRDLEKGQLELEHAKLANEYSRPAPQPNITLPPAISHFLSPYLTVCSLLPHRSSPLPSYP